MTREQMIAWLTLEGWRPYLDTGARGRRRFFELHNDTHAVYRNALNLDSMMYYAELSCIDVENSRPCEWDDFSDDEVRQLYRYVVERLYEP